ncbi:hypothetical protein CK203_035501 [Vitis vinifera]|uniref:Uncharacterized protein n=1 Tax=Vitis vinifera TaxID=29760 RepID=A0A438I3T8_VITVI|nr:hypothetical protein CK203_035501 [Vitis vinifera]
MQGRESEKRSNIQQFRMAMRNAKRSTSCRTESKTVKNEFRTLCEISASLAKPKLRKMNFAPCVKFRKPCKNPPIQTSSEDVFSEDEWLGFSFLGLKEARWDYLEWPILGKLFRLLGDPLVISYEPLKDFATLRSRYNGGQTGCAIPPPQPSVNVEAQNDEVGTNIDLPTDQFMEHSTSSSRPQSLMEKEITTAVDASPQLGS